ncbi:Rid family detoxifying hydrolase [Nonomuraea bangladeshensis]|uniref:RidA family protein n=1 Tax=Nonomuraea bangladeshensis TaxID=404385 RepID=UPI0031D1A7C1
MSKRVINSGSALGPYSSAVVAGDHCYVAGTGGLVPGTAQVVEGGIEAEIRQTMDNLQSVITEAGFRMDEVVSVTCYLRDMADWPLLNKIYSTYFTDEPPARAAVAVGDMPAGLNVELTCIAWRGGRS